MSKSNQQIINEISKIVNPYMKFNLEDIYNTPYPDIDNLTFLHFKYCKNNYINKCMENELLEKINSLGIGNAKIITCGGIGKFMIITLDKYHQIIIKKYNTYLDYKNKYADRINEIYEYLNEKIPEEFVGWFLFNENENNF